MRLNLQNWQSYLTQNTVLTSGLRKSNSIFTLLCESIPNIFIWMHYNSRAQRPHKNSTNIDTILKEIISCVHILAFLSLFLCSTTVLLPKWNHVALVLNGSSALQNPVQQPLSCVPELLKIFHGFSAVKLVRGDHTPPVSQPSLTATKKLLHIIYSWLVCQGSMLTAE